MVCHIVDQIIHPYQRGLQNFEPVDVRFFKHLVVKVLNAHFVVHLKHYIVTPDFELLNPCEWIADLCLQLLDPQFIISEPVVLLDIPFVNTLNLFHQSQIFLLHAQNTVVHFAPTRDRSHLQLFNKLFKFGNPLLVISVFEVLRIQILFVKFKAHKVNFVVLFVLVQIFSKKLIGFLHLCGFGIQILYSFSEGLEIRDRLQLPIDLIDFHSEGYYQLIY